MRHALHGFMILVASAAFVGFLTSLDPHPVIAACMWAVVAASMVLAIALGVSCGLSLHAHLQREARK